MSNRRSFESTPFIDAVLEEVANTMLAWGQEKPTTAELIEWVFLDIATFSDDVPASGMMSPNLRGILSDAYAKVGGKPGDMSDPERPYRGHFSERIRPVA